MVALLNHKRLLAIHKDRIGTEQSEREDLANPKYQLQTTIILTATSIKNCHLPLHHHALASSFLATS